MARRPPTPPPPAAPPADVRLMNVASSTIFALAVLTLLAAGVLWLTRAPWFAIRSVQIEGHMVHSNLSAVRAHALPRLHGNFFSLDLQAARQAFEAVPWVRSAIVRRVWPDRLAVRLQEHHAVALWVTERSQTRLVNSFGEVFDANPADVEDETLPVFDGPRGQSPALWAMYRKLQPLLSRSGTEVRRLELSARGSWRVESGDGMHIELGRGSVDDVLARVDRFTRTSQQLIDQYAKPLLSADLRYAGGYAVRLQGVTTTQSPPPAAPAAPRSH